MDNQEDKKLKFEQFDERYGELDLCVKCNQKRKDKHENKHSELCSNCRDEQLKIRIPSKIILFIGLICIVIIISLFNAIGSIERYSSYLDAKKHIEKKEYLFAYQNYANLLEEYAYSKDMAFKTIQTALDAQYISDAAYYFDEYIAGKELDDYNYEKAGVLLDKINHYFDTYYAVEEIMKNLDSETDYETYQFKVREELKLLAQDRDTDKTQINYYRALFSYTPNEAKEYYELSIAADEQFTYSISVYGNALRRNQEFDAAKDMYNYGLSLNACDGDSLAGLGKIELLIGDKKKGLELIEKAYLMEPYSIYMPDAYIIALNENGLVDKIDEVRIAANEAGYEFDNEIDQYLNKEISLWEYYVDEEVTQ